MHVAIYVTLVAPKQHEVVIKFLSCLTLLAVGLVSRPDASASVVSATRVLGAAPMLTQLLPILLAQISRTICICPHNVSYFQKELILF